MRVWVVLSLVTAAFAAVTTSATAMTCTGTGQEVDVCVSDENLDGVPDTVWVCTWNQFFQRYTCSPLDPTHPPIPAVQNCPVTQVCAWDTDGDGQRDTFRISQSGTALYVSSTGPLTDNGVEFRTFGTQVIVGAWWAEESDANPTMERAFAGVSASSTLVPNAPVYSTTSAYMQDYGQGDCVDYLYVVSTNSVGSTGFPISQGWADDEKDLGCP